MSQAFFYDAEGQDRQIELDKVDSIEKLGENQLVWFDIERTDHKLLERLQSLLHLGEAQDLLQSSQTGPNVVTFEDCFMLSLQTAAGAKPRVDYVVGKEWLLTVHDEDIEYFASYRQRDRGETLIGRLSSVALTGSLLDYHFDEYQQAAADIFASLDRLDTNILGRRKTRPPLSLLAKIRQKVSTLRARLDSHRSVVRALIRPDFLAIVDAEGSEFFSVLENHFERAGESLDRARDAVASSFDLYATKTAQDTNDLVRLLTLVTVATGLGSAIAGIFGMNFDIPVFHTGATGFAAAVGGIIALGGGMFLVAWRRGWLSS